MLDWQNIVSGKYLLLAFLAFVVFRFLRAYKEHSALKRIPVAGGVNFLGSYLFPWKYIKYGNEIITEAYKQHYPGLFRVPTWDGWVIFVTSTEHIDEMRKAPDDTLSFVEAVRTNLALDYTMGRPITANGYHNTIVKTQLNRATTLAEVFSPLYDEISKAFEERFPLSEEWMTHRVHEEALSVVSRITNRVLVGLPICRDPEYIKLNVDFAVSVIVVSSIVKRFPTFMMGLVANRFANVERFIKSAMKHIGPIAEERKRNEAKYGKDYDKPNDMLTWIMDAAPPEEQNARGYALRILTLNFAAIHTTTMTFTHSLLELASHPEYIKPLREEVHAAVDTYGWTKQGMDHMPKLDSFVKEDLRVAGLGIVAMNRLVLQDYVFSDGTRIPKGSRVQVAQGPRHLDERIYPDAKEFKGFRFSDMDEGESGRYQLVATSPDFLQFGHGKHACPGRFFAALEIKALLAHILIHYDIQSTGKCPQHTYFQDALVIDSHAEVLLRRRRANSD